MFGREEKEERKWESLLFFILKHENQSFQIVMMRGEKMREKCVLVQDIKISNFGTILIKSNESLTWIEYEKYQKNKDN